MKKFLFFILALVINFLIANSCFAENFYIKNYDVEMKVEHNKNIKIVETIDVFFTKESHGIYRTIPIRNDVVRTDDTSYTSHSKIKNIKVDNEHTVQNTNNNIKIKIGSPKKLVNGEQRYTISYDYFPSDDNLKENDELYFNIIGTEWNTTIEKASFYIDMPYSFDKEKIGLSIGTYGTVGFNEKEAEIYSDGKIIEGEITRTLTPKEGVTIRVLLPKNYFTKEVKTDVLPICIILILTLIASFMWFHFGKDEQIIQIVNFYPPERRNSAEISVEYKGYACNKALVSLIIYLASKGYIKIDETKHTYSLHKLKEYDGKNQIEKGLIDAIFGGYDYITKDELEKSPIFYQDCIALKEKLNKIKTRIFDSSATSWEKLLIVGICVLGILLSMLYALFDYSLDFLLDSAVLQLSIIFIIAGGTTYFRVRHAPILIKILFLIWNTGFILTPIINTIFYIQNPEKHIEMLIIGLICLTISIICLVNMPKRSKKGTKSLGEILGFKHFLEVAERNRIRKLVEENPQYCYDILPFAYVLGVSEEWIKKFEGIMLTPPVWYSGKLNHRSFSRLITSLEAISVPSQENGGIKVTSLARSGGGGFSGGGIGGGGGGSW